MKVNRAEFIISAVKPEQYPKEGLPEIALAGRSNVGKSSFINRMIGRKSLARTSSKPGKTQTLNFYKIEEQLYFVDVPGYGYAKVSKTEREAWGKMIERYLTGRSELCAVCLLIDFRHPPTEDDCLMYNFLTHYHLPTIVIATKVDKIPKGKWEKQRQMIAHTLQLASHHPLILFSSETGLGRDEAWKVIQAYQRAERH